MSALLYSLGRWCFRRKKTVIAAWLAALVLLGVAAGSWGGSPDNRFEIPSSRSQEALDRLRMTFPEGAQLSAMAVVVVPDRVENHRAEIEDAVAEFDRISIVDQATSPWSEGVDGLVSDGGRAAIVRLGLTLDLGEPSEEDLEPITAVAERLAEVLPEGSQVAMGGEAYNTELPEFTVVEVIGLGVALVVLTVVLGSLVAAGLPLLTAVTGVGIAMAAMMLLANVFSVNSTTPLLSVMLGLAVGIDYALFILSRHRDQLRSGLDAQESAGRAVGTAGSAVVFAGLTVFIALLGLAVAGIAFLTTMGVFAALTVAVAVIIALTLLPALMGLLGERMRPKPRRRKHMTSRSGVYAWWVGVVTRHPVATIVAVVVVLGALTVPAAGLRVALPNAGQMPQERSTRVAYDLLADNFGPGVNGPLVVTADIIGSTDPIGLVNGLAEDIENLDGVANVALATPNRNADTGLIQVVPDSGPDDPATADLVRALQDQHDQWLAKYGVNTSVTGSTAVQIDVSERLSAALIPFGVLVVGLSLVLLAAVFRSVWVPLKATAGYLLSVGAAFGVTTMVFNHGLFKEVVNLERPIPVISFLPILLMGILFGLAMDYEVFLVSRIREEYVHGASPVEAIRSGFVASGPVVTAAAIIMFAVFAFFVPEGMVSIKAIAFALAIGIAVDAFLVRMTLGPAVMALLGRRAWWLPGWLERLLPSFDVEGETLTAQMELRDWPGDDSVLYADDLAVDGVVDPLNVRLIPGNVVGLIGPVRSRTGTALALSGRLATTSGRARVAGALLPQAAGHVRRRVGYVDLTTVDDVAAALAAIDAPTVVFIDSVERVATSAHRTQLIRLIDRVRPAGAVVLAAALEEHLAPYRIDGFLAPTTVPEEVSA